MKTRMILTGMIAALLSAPLAAQAADLPAPTYKAPAYVAPAAPTWTGFYIGLNGGYVFGEADVSNAFGDFTTDSHDGYLIGATLGYNLQTGRWVWGVEGDIDYAAINGETSNTLACPAGTCEVENNWLATLRGRVGYSFGRWMPYFTGGGAFAGTKVTVGGSSSNETATGWTVGAGVEYAFLGAWSAKLEYLYADLGPVTCEATTCGVATDIEPKINIVRAGINYRF